MSDTLLNSDTLRIENYAVKVKAFISHQKLHLQTEPKDTAVKVLIKNAVRETHSQANHQKVIEKQKNQSVIFWVLLLLAILLYVGFSGRK